MKKITVVASIIVVIILLLAIVASCAPRIGSPANLSGVEIREYEGKNLSSINDFRENSIKGPQQVDISSYKLAVRGLVAKPAEYEYNGILTDFSKYKKVVTLNCVEGWSTTILWEGILVKDLIKQASPQQTAKTIIFHAADGYTTSFPIEYVLNRDILLAYKMNDVSLPVERGFPFQLVAESKWGYKWIKWVTEIELSDNINYKGYWESRGYSNDGDLDKDMFD